MHIKLLMYLYKSIYIWESFKWRCACLERRTCKDRPGPGRHVRECGVHSEEAHAHLIFVQRNPGAVSKLLRSLFAVPVSCPLSFALLAFLACFCVLHRFACYPGLFMVIRILPSLQLLFSCVASKAWQQTILTAQVLQVLTLHRGSRLMHTAWVGKQSLLTAATWVKQRKSGPGISNTMTYCMKGRTNRGNTRHGRTKKRLRDLQESDAGCDVPGVFDLRLKEPSDFIFLH